MDVVILGGGPAGAAAAITAVGAGLDVVLLERANLPRHRPGETLHPGIEPLLAHLGARETILAAGYLRHVGTWVEWDGPPLFEPFGADAGGSWRGFQVTRADFDARLLAVAAEGGVDVRQGCAAVAALTDGGRVTGVRTPHGALRARFTLDASGDRHWLARQLGIRVLRGSRPLVVRYGYMAGDCPARDEAPRIKADQDGWTWTGRLAPGLYQWIRLDRQPGRLPRAWRPSDLAGLSDAGPLRGADVTWRIAERTAGPGFFLVGDAALVLDPASGHGVMRAMMSGIMAAHAIVTLADDYRREPAIIRGYHAWLSRWFDHDARRLGEAYARIGLPLTRSVETC